MNSDEERVVNSVVDKILLTINNIPSDRYNLSTVIRATLAFERYRTLKEVTEQLENVADHPTTLTGEMRTQAEYWKTQRDFAQEEYRELLTGKKSI